MERFRQVCDGLPQANRGREDSILGLLKLFVIEIVDALTNWPEISTEGQCLAISEMTTLKGGRIETHRLLDWRRAARDCSIHSGSQCAEGCTAVRAKAAAVA
jgi:hypothetical protein